MKEKQYQITVCGSGSTGVACINTNRRFVGIELDKEYFEIASKRINLWLENKKEVFQMNNKDIEEDIKILRDITKQDFNNPMGWTGYYDSELKELQQAIKNILTDRERLEKENAELTTENFKLNIELENKRKEYQETYKDVREEIRELQAKAKRYDSLVEKIKENLDKRKQKYNEILNDYGNIDTDVIFNIPNVNVRKRLDELSLEIVILQELLDTEK